MIQGGIIEFLQALRARESDASFSRVLENLGGNAKVDLYTDRGIEEKFLAVSDRGVDFLVLEGVLRTIFIYARKTRSHERYAGWPSLVAGIDATSSRADIQNALGEPIATSHEFIRYRNEHGYLQFEFDGETLSMAVVLAEVVDRE